MESKAELKRLHILTHAKQLIYESGFEALTLEAVAKKAAISKGGLLYHFPNKELLIKGLASYIFEAFVQRFYELGESDPNHIGKWTRALIESTREDLHQNAELNIGLIATSILEPEVSKNISVGYKSILKKLQEDGLPPVTVDMIRLAIDGLYYTQILQVAPLEKEKVNEVIQQLLQMTKY